MECLQPNCGHKWITREQDQVFAATVSVSTTTTLCYKVGEILSGTWKEQLGCCPKCHPICKSSNPKGIHSCQPIGNIS